MSSAQELFQLADKLEAAAAPQYQPEIAEPLKALEAAAEEVGRSHSSSWLGYHANVYYEGLVPPPPGALFSREWGLMHMYSSRLGSHGDWRQFDPKEVISAIYRLAGDPNLNAARAASDSSNKAFDAERAEVDSILSTEVETAPDPFISKLRDELSELVPVSKGQIVQHWMPKGRIITRDTTAGGQGNWLPPHFDVLSDVAAVQRPFALCSKAAVVARKAASHLERKSRRMAAEKRVGTNVAIGHGRSLLWRELKDFIEDRLHLPVDEFNRVPVAGVTNVARLAEMLDAAALALLVMTAEDETADGNFQPRMNVVHEAGLFQGRLGFTKAIVLLEEGCQPFSNIEGLGQIRFPKGKIFATFEEVRRVLEREGLIEAS